MQFSCFYVLSICFVDLLELDQQVVHQHSAFEIKSYNDYYVFQKIEQIMLIRYVYL